MKKIIIAGLYKDKNLGDQVIAESYEFIARSYNEESNEVTFQRIDLDGFAYYWKNCSFIKRKIRSGIRRLLKILRIHDYQKEVSDQHNYFTPLISGASSIVVVGGGLIKFEYQSFWSMLSGLIYAAEEQQVPIALNAVGVEGYDDSNQRCKILKDALNRPCVKIVTTRDDFPTLRNQYFRENAVTVIKKVADPAVHASSTYECE